MISGKVGCGIKSLTEPFLAFAALKALVVQLLNRVAEQERLMAKQAFFIADAAFRPNPIFLTKAHRDAGPFSQRARRSPPSAPRAGRRSPAW